MFIVVSQSDIHIGFRHQFLRARKDGHLERNLSNPDLVSLKTFTNISFSIRFITLYCNDFKSF